MGGRKGREDREMGEGGLGKQKRKAGCQAVVVVCAMCLVVDLLMPRHPPLPISIPVSDPILAAHHPVLA